MISINSAKRLVKRALLSNITSKRNDLAITPLISGKHGIGKSQIVKSIAQDLGGVCITIEGGTLKEGEITGLPYQYVDENGATRFRFLPYYAVERIQAEEKLIYLESGRKLPSNSALSGDENRFALNDLTPEEKIAALKDGRVTPVIVFIDEINRTENAVYKELMNILLTRSVNGYHFPWWVFFVAAMNPSTQYSVYSTNEMDPAQLDRFLKIRVGENSKEWLAYAKGAGFSPSILSFIKENPACLSNSTKELTDEEKPTPSPRGWEMVDTILASEPSLRCFFSTKENTASVVERDMKALVASKLGSSVATMYFASLSAGVHALTPEEVFGDDADLSNVLPSIRKMSAAKRVQSCDAMLEHLKSNIEFLMLDRKGYEKKKEQLKILVNALDPSTKLLFAQKVASATTDDGNPLISLLYDVFESDLLETLDLSETTRNLIKGK